MAARCLDIPIEKQNYITSLIPTERGETPSLIECYYGSDDWKAIPKFKKEMDENPELWALSKRIQGIITKVGIHAAGVIITNNHITESSSIMKNSDGQLITAFDLSDSEYCGLVKYDFLSVDGLTKERIALNLLLKDNLIEWKNSLRETYLHYLKPTNLNNDENVWNNIANNKVYSLWQLNTDVGLGVLGKVKAKSLKELAIINNLMRLMKQDGADLSPTEIFIKYRDNIELWYDEMKSYGLTLEEIEVLEKHLLPLCGVADSQESVMMMVMDEKIGGFSVAEANKLRKSIAKKSPKAQEEAKQLLFEKGVSLGVRPNMLSYVWNVQIARMLGYSFSAPHTIAYSMIALQQANLYTHYPHVYWNTACLISDAKIYSQEDDQELIDKGYLKTKTITTKKGKSSKRGAMAVAISEFQKEFTISPPDINVSGYGFQPNGIDNSISCGFKIVSGMGDQFIDIIIKNRPYSSFNDFISKVKLSKDRVVMLIKANAFRNIETKSRDELLNEYIISISEVKKKLTLSNVNELIERNLIPDTHLLQKQIYRYEKYIKAINKSIKNPYYYFLDEISLERFNNDITFSSVNLENGNKVDKMQMDKIFKQNKESFRVFISGDNHDKTLKALNEAIINEQIEKYGMNNSEQGEMQAMRFYIEGHEIIPYLSELSNIIEISSIEDIESEEIDRVFTTKEGDTVKMLKLHHIVGTVIEKEKKKNTVTLLTIDGPIKIKYYKETYPYYDKKVMDGKNTIQTSFFENGSILLVTGFLRDTTFIPKKYNSTKIKDVTMRLVLNEDGHIGFEQKIQ